MFKKLLLTCLFCSLMSIGDLNAQNNIQRRFVGLNFLQNYGNVYNSIRYISAEYSNQAVTAPDTLMLYDVRFGGYIWEYATLNFDVKGNGDVGRSRACFYCISFSQHYSDYDDACKTFNHFYDMLCQKYWYVDFVQDGIDYSATWKDNSTLCCLRLNYGEAVNGETYWFVSLNYCDINTINAYTNDAMGDL